MVEVGEYVRDTDGLIIKVNEIQGYEEDDDLWYEQETLKGTWRSMITKHSKNIIDLIEVGDYVNGYKVTGIMSGYVYLDKINVETRKVKTLADYQIETILTHELYEQNCYKVGDIE